jgi:hypothetical protein
MQGCDVNNMIYAHLILLLSAALLLYVRHTRNALHVFTERMITCAVYIAGSSNSFATQSVQSG